VLKEGGYDFVFARRGTPWLKYCSANAKNQKKYEKFEKAQYDVDHFEEWESASATAEAVENVGDAEKGQMPHSDPSLRGIGDTNKGAKSFALEEVQAPKSEQLGESAPETVRETLVKAAQNRNLIAATSESKGGSSVEGAKQLRRMNKEDGCIIAWKTHVFDLQYPAYAVNFDDLAHDGASLSEQLHQKHHHRQVDRQTQLERDPQEQKVDNENPIDFATVTESNSIDITMQSAVESHQTLKQHIRLSSDAKVAATQSRFYRHNIGAFVMLFPRQTAAQEPRSTTLSRAFPDLHNFHPEDSSSEQQPQHPKQTVVFTSHAEDVTPELRMARLFARPVIVATTHLYFNPNSEDVKFWQILYMTRVLEYYRLTAAVHLYARTKITQRAIAEYLDALSRHGARTNNQDLAALAQLMEKMLLPEKSDSTSTALNSHAEAMKSACSVIKAAKQCCGKLAVKCAVCSGASPLLMTPEEADELASKAATNSTDLVVQTVERLTNAIADFRQDIVTRNSETSDSKEFEWLNTVPAHIEQSIPVVLCGDLNSTPDSSVYRFLATGKIPLEQVVSETDQSRSMRMAAAAQANAEHITAAASSVDANDRSVVSTDSVSSTSQATSGSAELVRVPPAGSSTAIPSQDGATQSSTDADAQDGVCKVSPFVVGSPLVPANEAIAQAIATIKDRMAPKGCNASVQYVFVPNFSTAPETHSQESQSVSSVETKSNIVPRVLVSQGLGRVTKALRALGFDAVEVERSSTPQEISNLLRIAREEKRILITDSRNLLRRSNLPPFILLPSAPTDPPYVPRISTDGASAVALLESARAGGKDTKRGKKGLPLEGLVQGSPAQQKQRQTYQKILVAWAKSQLNSPKSDVPRELMNIVHEARLKELAEDILRAHGYAELDVHMLKMEMRTALFEEQKRARSTPEGPFTSSGSVMGECEDQPKWSLLPALEESQDPHGAADGDIVEPVHPSSSKSNPSAEAASASAEAAGQSTPPQANARRLKFESAGDYRSPWARELEHITEAHQQHLEIMSKMESEIAKASVGESTVATNPIPSKSEDPSSSRGHLSDVAKPKDLRGYILAEQLKPSAKTNIDFRIQAILDAFKDQYSPSGLLLRCTRCNGLYRNISLEEVRMDPSIPDGVKEGVNHINGKPLHFYQCVHCLRIYWWGRKSMVVAERMRRHLLKFKVGVPDDASSAQATGDEENEDDDDDDDLGADGGGMPSAKRNVPERKKESKSDPAQLELDATSMAQAAADSVAGSRLAPSIARTARILPADSPELQEIKAIIAARETLPEGEPMRQDYVNYQLERIKESGTQSRYESRVENSSSAKPRFRKEIQPCLAVTSISGREVVHILPDGSGAVIPGEPTDSLLIESLQSLAKAATVPVSKQCSTDRASEEASFVAGSNSEVLSPDQCLTDMRSELKSHTSYFCELSSDWNGISFQANWLALFSDAATMLFPRPRELLRFLSAMDYSTCAAEYGDGIWRMPAAAPAIAALEELLGRDSPARKGDPAGLVVKCPAASLSTETPKSVIEELEALSVILMSARAATYALEMIVPEVKARYESLCNPSNALSNFPDPERSEAQVIDQLRERLATLLQRRVERQNIISYQRQLLRHYLLAHRKSGSQENIQPPEPAMDHFALLIRECLGLPSRVPLPRARLVVDCNDKLVQLPALLSHQERFGIPVVSPPLVLAALILPPPSQPVENAGNLRTLVSSSDCFTPQPVFQRLETVLLKLLTAVEMRAHQLLFGQKRDSVLMSQDYRRTFISNVLESLEQMLSSQAVLCMSRRFSLLAVPNWARLYALQASPRVLRDNLKNEKTGDYNSRDSLVLETNLPLVSAYADYQLYEFMCLAPTPAMRRSYSKKNANASGSLSPVIPPTLMREPSESFVTDVITDEDDKRSYEERVSRVHVVEHLRPGFPNPTLTLAEYAVKQFGTVEDINSIKTVGALEPQFTNRTAKFTGCLDYIFYTSNVPSRSKSDNPQTPCSSIDSTISGGNLYLQAERRWRIFTAEEVAKTGGLPCRDFPSDHIPLAAVFKMNGCFEWVE